MIHTNLRSQMGVVLAIIVLLLSSSILPFGFDNSVDDHVNLVVKEADTCEKQSKESNMEITRAPVRPARDDAHGGSWSDSFEDDAGVDWGMSNHIGLRNGSLIIFNDSIDSNTIAFWHFNEYSGVTAFDATSNNHDGKLGGDGIGTDLPTWTTGKLGNGLNFDGDDYIDSTYDAKGSLSELTFTVWVKPNTFKGNDFVMGRYATSSTGVILRYLSNGKWQFADVTNSKGVYSNNYAQTNVWTHLAGTIDAAGNIKIYINGVQQTDTKTGASAGSLNLNVTIGWSTMTGPQPQFFNGIMDEVSISNVARTPLEIKDLYENGSSGACELGSTTSTIINLPEKMIWDTLLINKTQPVNTYINVTVLDASNNQPIPGSPTYSGNGEFDISSIDPVQYPSIKLNAVLEGDGETTPELHYWSVSWNMSNTWRDTLFGGEKVESSANLEAVDGNVQLAGGIDSSTVALWHFDKGSGTIAYDATPNDNDGTLGGDGVGNDIPTWTTGKFGNALNFDGSNDHINITKNKISSIWNKFSICAWIKLNEHKYYNRIINDDGFVFATDNDGRIWARIWDDTYWSDNYYSNQNISIGNWTHVAITHDSALVTSNLKAYINGILDPITLNCQHPANNSGGTLVIGSASYLPANFFNGTIDEIVIFNRCLNALEIKDIYDNGTNRNYPRGTLRSKPIQLPINMCWDTLIINKTKPLDTAFNVTILDGITNQPIPGYQNLTGAEIDILSINPLVHNSIKLQATFGSNGFKTSILHDWSVKWAENTAPKFIDIKSPPQINRTESALICINVSDREESEENLTLKVKYKSTPDSDWPANWITIPYYSNDHYYFTFLTSRFSDVGFYSFKVMVNDSFQYLNITTHPDLIEVINNKPTQPDVYISPVNPRTTDDLIVFAENSTDIDYGGEELERPSLWYRWYNNGFHLQAFDNETKIPNSETNKDDTWRCMVYPADELDIGIPGEAEVVIQNTPPELAESFTKLEMMEDVPVILEEKLLKMFADVDSDVLTFSTSGQKNIIVEITQDNSTIKFTPAENWFGTEEITFYANDYSHIQAEQSIQVTVHPTNDLPIIFQVGDKNILNSDPELPFDFIAREDDWFNLTILAVDVDGDVERDGFEYKWNLTDKSNFYLTNNKIIFKPTDEDVGLNYINISITDNNETPPIYLSKEIFIDVQNINDLPSVMIVTPESNKEFLETDDITFICEAKDDDLLVSDTKERLKYEWYTNKSELGTLGIADQIMVSNRTIPPGYYNITVMVEDGYGEEAYDSVEIVIKGVPKTPEKTASDKTGPDYLVWLIILIIVIIIVILSIFLVITSKKKKEHQLEAMAGPPEQALAPEGAYQPNTSLVSFAQTSEGVRTQGGQGPPLEVGTQYVELQGAIDGITPIAPPGLAQEALPTEPSTAITPTPPAMPTVAHAPMLPSGLEYMVSEPEPTQHKPHELPAEMMPPAVETPTTETPQLETPPEAPPESVQQPILLDQPQPPEPPQMQEQPVHQESNMETPQPQQHITPTLLTPQDSHLTPQPVSTQPLMTQCPLCQQQIAEYTNPCPHCGGVLEWGGSS
ncbi:LamG-like jellyroll fold domain-containing protein [[Eubacterium] cellulosolvens]